MEGNKNAMYAQAGRNRGWQVVSEEAAMKPHNAPEKLVTPVIPVIPAPPVVAAPISAPPPKPIYEPAPSPAYIAPATAAHDAEVHAKGCQKIAMAYVEMQKWQETYEAEQGFHRGTLFTELDLPFVGEGACKHG